MFCFNIRATFEYIPFYFILWLNFTTNKILQKFSSIITQLFSELKPYEENFHPHYIVYFMAYKNICFIVWRSESLSYNVFRYYFWSL